MRLTSRPTSRARMMADDPLANRRPLASRRLGIMRRLAEGLARAGVSPNAISVAGIGFALIAALALLQAGAAGPLRLGGAPWAAGWLVAALGVQLRLLANLLDGLVAVEGGLGSPLGRALQRGAGPGGGHGDPLGLRGGGGLAGARALGGAGGDGLRLRPPGRRRARAGAELHRADGEAAPDGRGDARLPAGVRRGGGRRRPGAAGRSCSGRCSSAAW